MGQESYSERHQKASLKRLKEKVNTKFNTAIIFAIAEFEKSFSHLWGGIEKDVSDMTKEQYSYYVMWKNIRKEILDNGNKQKRAFQKELDQHTIEFNGFTTELIPKRRNAK